MLHRRLLFSFLIVMLAGPLLPLGKPIPNNGTADYYSYEDEHYINKASNSEAFSNLLRSTLERHQSGHRPETLLTSGYVAAGDLDPIGRILDWIDDNKDNFITLTLTGEISNSTENETAIDVAIDNGNATTDVIVENGNISSSSANETTGTTAVPVPPRHAPFDVCWRDVIGRGAGRPIHACPDDYEMVGLLCYPICQENYTGIGPVCWENCRQPFVDSGVLCSVFLNIVASNSSDCPWYDICGLTFARGCSKCPVNDPPYEIDGCTCRVSPQIYSKQTYGRGVAKVLGCNSTEDYDAGLCYDKCPDNYHGIGPVCWEDCPEDLPVDHGVTCARSKDSLSQMVSEASMAVVSAMAAATGEAADSPRSETDAVKESLERASFKVFPFCKNA